MSDFSVRCPYCSRTAELVSDSEIYTKPRGRWLWLCKPCKAWAMTDETSPRHKPIARMAKHELRLLQIRINVLFNEAWQMAAARNGWKPQRARSVVGRWIAKRMDISEHECRLSFMDEEQSARIVELLERSLRREVA